MNSISIDLSRIERSIDIDASAERVWALIARPGWWINDGTIDLTMPIRREGELDIVVHPKWGEFRFRTIESDQPRRLVYEWISDAAQGTIVEFRIQSRSAGGVTLSVVETGFDQLGKDHQSVVHHVTENTVGWEDELAAARRFINSQAASA